MDKQGLPDNWMMLSIIIPCFNEEPVLRATHERLTSVLVIHGRLGLPKREAAELPRTCEVNA